MFCMKGNESTDSKIIEIYIHIPFCVKKCSYCDFLSFPENREVQRAYIEALFAEIKGRAGEFRNYRVGSVFIGGGTPSLLPAEWIAELMGIVKTNFQFVSETVDMEAPVEITIEVNPGTVDEEKLRIYFASGINRLSIGLQSADDKELQMLGRIHTYEEFLQTYGAARRVGFTNINVDVMSALPGQSLDSYCDTLHKVLALNPPPEHISAYSLIVEEGTPFARWQEEGKLDLPDEDCDRTMYEETKRILAEAGLKRYEISNYAIPGFECRHNCGYWKRVDYVGFGIGAASLVDQCRFQNDNDLQKYITEPLACRTGFQRLSVDEQMEETMFLGLRMTEGVNVIAFKENYGRTLEEVFGSVMEQNVQEGLLQYRVKACYDIYIALTERGLDISNYVMSQFLLT